ncbi:hypothetical protein PTNB73_03388 [Pyrenophora teres f. teres]|nr:hypothetical protein HRS9122_04147 [Pyrenophora teres f. teres]KAE8871929.1 hypothetical protein PTNB73_03388 [Pyrenophora teres f. teres]
MGATLAGVLYYHGEIRSNIRNKIPLQDWDFEAVLAYFRSNSNDNMSFSVANYNKTATKVQHAYMMACAEENRAPNILMRNMKSIYYRELFIKELQKSPGDFDIYSQTRSRGIQKEQERLFDQSEILKAEFQPNDPRLEKMIIMGLNMIQLSRCVTVNTMYVGSPDVGK